MTDAAPDATRADAGAAPEDARTGGRRTREAVQALRAPATARQCVRRRSGPGPGALERRRDRRSVVHLEPPRLPPVAARARRHEGASRPAAETRAVQPTYGEATARAERRAGSGRGARATATGRSACARRPPCGATRRCTDSPCSDCRSRPQRARRTCARSSRSKLGDADEKTCLRDALRKLEFKPPPRRPRRRGTLGQAVARRRARPTGRATRPRQRPGKSRRARYVRYREGHERRARDGSRLLRRSEHGAILILWGRIQLRVDLDDKGRVQRVRENESHFPARAVVRCAIEALSPLRFPPAKGGALSFCLHALRLGELHPLPSASAQNQ